jgi:hypothetical protein
MACHHCGIDNGSNQEFVSIFAKSSSWLDENGELVSKTVVKPLVVKTCRRCWGLLKPRAIRLFAYYIAIFLAIIIPAIFCFSALIANWTTLFGGHFGIGALTVTGGIIAMVMWYFVATGGIIKPLFKWGPMAPEEWLCNSKEAAELMEQGFKAIAFLDTNILRFTPQMLYDFEGVYIRPVPRGLRKRPSPVSGELSVHAPDKEVDVTQPPAVEFPRVEGAKVLPLRGKFRQFISKFSVVEDYSGASVEGMDNPEAPQACVHCGVNTDYFFKVMGKKSVVAEEDVSCDTVTPVFRIFNFPLCNRCRRGSGFISGDMWEPFYPSQIFVVFIWALGIMAIVMGIMINLDRMEIYRYVDKDPFEVLFYKGIPIIIIWTLFVIFFRFFVLRRLNKYLMKRKEKGVAGDVKVQRLNKRAIMETLLRDGWIPVYGAKPFQHLVKFRNNGEFINAFSAMEGEFGWLLKDKVGEFSEAGFQSPGIYGWPDVMDALPQSGQETEGEKKCELCFETANESVEILVHRKECIENENKRGMLHGFGVIGIPVCRKCRRAHKRVFRRLKKPFPWWQVIFAALSIFGLVIPLYLAGGVTGDHGFGRERNTWHDLGIGLGYLLSYALFVFVVLGVIINITEGREGRPLLKFKRVRNIRDFKVIREAMQDGWEPVHKLTLGDWKLTPRFVEYLAGFINGPSRQPVQLLDHNDRKMKKRECEFIH